MHHNQPEFIIRGQWPPKYGRTAINVAAYQYTPL